MKIEPPKANGTDSLGDEYQAFCDSFGLSHATSSQQLANLKHNCKKAQAQIAWLESFEKRWQEIERFETDALTLSRYISAIMQVALSPGRLAKVNQTNAQNGMKLGCASHDMIDANIVVYGAFAAMFFREMDCADECDANLVNAAWSLAMESKYGVAC